MQSIERLGYHFHEILKLLVSQLRELRGLHFF